MPEPPHAWHHEVLPDGWARAADDLAARSVLDGFYLAGGTGLALQYGHRRSVDLDLFSPRDFDPADLQHRLGGLNGLTIHQAAPGTLHLALGGILVSVLRFPHPQLFPLLQFEWLAVADPRDIACMKVHAIASFGNRRDFVDLYLAATQYGLSQMLAWFETKLAPTPSNRVHLLKSLTDFKDAEAQPVPDMLVPLEWTEVTRFFATAVPCLSRLM